MFERRINSPKRGRVNQNLQFLIVEICNTQVLTLIIKILYDQSPSFVLNLNVWFQCYCNQNPFMY